MLALHKPMELKYFKSMSKTAIFENLSNLLSEASEIPLQPDDHYVIFSDLHMGNGSDRDDFLRNSQLFSYILENYYLKSNFRLILNGDIEELQKFSHKEIQTRWENIFDLFEQYDQSNNLIKIYGNHDIEPFHETEFERKFPSLPAIKLNYDGNTIFIFHGHQASVLFEKYNNFTGFVLKNVAHPLRIKNRTTAYDSQRKYRVERKVYAFSNRNKIVSIIGHTHRPLFESLSYFDWLKFKIENLCRSYLTATPQGKAHIEEDIQYYKKEIQKHAQLKRKKHESTGLYNSSMIVPSLFNSGCVIGKRGITSIEISTNKIRLVHWFDRKKSKKFLNHHNGYKPRLLDKTDFYRKVLKEDSLDYVFTRIKLLT